MSVVMPAYNCEAYIAEAIASVQAQTYEHWDLIVVDDCSADDTIRVAREWSDRERRVRVLASRVNGGTAHARNLGLTQSRGRYVAFLDADDVWMPEKLEKQIAFMNRHHCGFSFTAYRKFGADGAGGIVRALPTVTWSDMLKGSRIGCSTVILDTEVFPDLRFPTVAMRHNECPLWLSLIDAERRLELIERGGREDYALWLSLLRGGDAALGLDEPLVCYRVHGASKTSRKLRAIAGQWVVYRDLEGISGPRAAWYLGNYAVRGLIKALR